MPVPRDQDQVMLQRKRADPQIVIWNRSTRTLQLNEQPGVLLGCLAAWKQYPYGLFCEEPPQQTLVSMRPVAAIKPCLDLGKHDHGNPDFNTDGEEFRQLGIAFEKVRQPVGVERDSHFHLSQSILR